MPKLVIEVSQTQSELTRLRSSVFSLSGRGWRSFQLELTLILIWCQKVLKERKYKANQANSRKCFFFIMVSFGQKLDPAYYWSSNLLFLRKLTSLMERHLEKKEIYSIERNIQFRLLRHIRFLLYNFIPKLSQPVLLLLTHFVINLL